jgi:hypothetical protein
MLLGMGGIGKTTLSVFADTRYYAGNPLALKIVAAAIQDFFDSNVANFLELLRQGTFVFKDIRNLLKRQFNRLSDLEKEVMFWLAIEREPVSFAELRADFVSSVSSSEILEALASLLRRSLIVKTPNGFCQEPVVMEYITEYLIERVCAEITTRETVILKNHALIKATTKDHIRETQVSLILKPIGDRLLATFLTNSSLEKHLTQFLSTLKDKSLLEIGYAGGNILNLLRQIEADRNGYDLSL